MYGAVNTGNNITNSVVFNSGDLLSISAVPSNPRPNDNLDVRWFARLTSI